MLRRLFQGLDYPLVGLTLLVSALGVAMIASATQGTKLEGLWVGQLAAIGVGLVVLLFAAATDYRRLADRAPLLLGLTLLILVATLVMAPRIAGTKRWLSVGPVQFQPSEFAKIIAALVVAKLFSEMKKDSLGLGDLLAPASVTAVLALAIAAAPDLGTAVSLLPMFFVGAFLAGLRYKSIVILSGFLLIFGLISWEFLLRDYQKARIYSFLDPDLDPRGSGYQKKQSQIAVGSGGLTGKGYGLGSQTQLGYLPARQTDFIFSVLAEEFGFVGVVATLGLYLALLWRCLDIARLARDRLGAILVACLTATLTFQVVYNVGMVAGLLPVKGLPLPLMSAGRSSVLATFISIGLILSVRMRRFAN
ncbi:MAG: rod shape-determining protein RodA [Vicinamibacteria bacterium]|nr:rod shape-determining protein RodA [Vicinamibacteria bacterium]